MPQRQLSYLQFCCCGSYSSPATPPPSSWSKSKLITRHMRGIWKSFYGNTPRRREPERDRERERHFAAACNAKSEERRYLLLTIGRRINPSNRAPHGFFIIPLRTLICHLTISLISIPCPVERRREVGGRRAVAFVSTKSFLAFTGDRYTEDDPPAFNRVTRLFTSV